MREELIDAATWGALPFFLVGLFIWSGRWRVFWLYACCGSLIYLLTSKSLFQWNELVLLGEWTDLNSAVVLLLAWSLFGALLAAIGGWRPVGPPWLASFLTGFVMGPIAAAITLSEVAVDKGAASRMTLSAAGGSLIGFAGNPTLLILSTQRPSVGWLYLPLALLFLWIASPKKGDIQPTIGVENRLFAFGSLVALSVCCFPAYAPILFLTGAICLTLVYFKKIRLPIVFGSLAWTLGVSVLAIGSTATGFPEMAVWEMEEMQHLKPDSVLSTMGLGGLFVSSFADAQGAALLGQAFVDRSMDLQIAGAIEVLACGLAAGGVLHLFAADVWQESFNRWAMQMAACMAYMFFLSEVVFV